MNIITDILVNFFDATISIVHFLNYSILSSFKYYDQKCMTILILINLPEFWILVLFWRNKCVEYYEYHESIYWNLLHVTCYSFQKETWNQTMYLTCGSLLKTLIWMWSLFAKMEAWNQIYVLLRILRKSLNLQAAV